MSLRSRARAIQRVMGITYQQALERIRSLGSAPAALARQTGWPLKACDAFLLTEPRRPVDVRTVAQSRPLSDLCEELRAELVARAVCIMDATGHWMAMSGFDAVRLLALPRELRVGNREPESLTLDPKGGVHILSCALETGARLFILFDERSSVGLVRLRARAAIREINRVLGGPLMFRPPEGGNSGSGAPAQISAFDGLFDRLGKLGSN
jgi:hypothetical protein